jgi:hypothetical protein
MIRTLLIITGASLVLCAASLGGAAALGGNDLARHGWEWTFRGHGDGEDETVRFERADQGPRVTRTLAWTGGDSLDVHVPAEVVYVQGDEASVEVSGSRSQVDRLRLTDGRLSFDDDDDADVVVFGWHNSPTLRITVTAPSVRNFSVSGSGDLSIRGYDQPDMMVSVRGSGDVDAAGRTGSVELDIHGSGEADLSALDTGDADVEISGSGEAAVGPTGDARIRISGSGDVELTRRPASVSQSISGSGDVHQR